MYSARKPYLKLKQSVGEFFRAPVRYLKDSVTKESQFEKPYMEDDYQAMHLNLPNPDWPSWDFSYDARWPSWPKGGGEAPGEEETPFFGGSMKEEETSCSYTLRQQYCSQVKDFGLDVEDAVVTGMRHAWGGDYPYEASTHYWSFEGEGENFIANIIETEPMKPGVFADVSPQAMSHRISFNWDTEKAKGSPTCYVATTLCYNIAGVCKHCLDIFDTNCCENCCDELPDGAFEFDDSNTPDTIVAGNSIDFYVKGGCGDFEYSVSGTGYTWHSTGTTTVTSSNRNEQLDCAAGT